jgi:hypothetical protein
MEHIMASLTPPSGHGGQIRGLTSASQDLGIGRFGRMFATATDRPRFNLDLLQELGDIMTGFGLPGDPDDGKPIRAMPDGTKPDDAGDENTTIPAGYTYFGQFVDHDITFDPTSLNDQTVDPTALQNFRTPALDLDSVYGPIFTASTMTEPICASAGRSVERRTRTGRRRRSTTTSVWRRRTQRTPTSVALR